MKAYLARIGYAPSDLNRLNIVHVAGTKGKGSTCAFVNSILSQYQSTPGHHLKCGLFISPHLVAVRERIRISSAPISEDLFAKYFFQVWDRLGSSSALPDDAVPGSRPLYARYLTLMSWHAFLQEGVNVAVYETGIGGEFDATNIVEKPLVAGISTLGIDHVYVLGETVDKIAWHKAGIIKAGSPAFTVEQVGPAAEVLHQRAREKGVTLNVLGIDPRLQGVKVRPDAQFQRKNATLAVALAATALQKLRVVPENLVDASRPLPRRFADGIEKTVFRGRCEVKVEDSIVWHVDGAHTADSLKESSRWFADETSHRNAEEESELNAHGVDHSTGPRVLIFNQQGRAEAVDFLESIQTTTSRPSRGKPSFDHAVFCTNVTHAKTGYNRDFVNRGIDPKEIESMSVQRRFADRWASIDPGAEVVVLPTIEEALDYARQVGDVAARVGDEKVQVYVTGSLHLVGGALAILEKAEAL
ncbi:hypothetical protein UVI_02031130 [Ustilaginoidea virens]|uniref:Folylpolyglutamate synthase n=1 Tax=Ustilaginoidea virens TaxID=1159556 RepID=A0A1B5L1C2_USTVR|nr:hypothetical protein UVI_02031130 [Ustilaginoidea virens]